jgi:hypothetical protein
MHAREAIASLLDERGPGKSICPSEAARRLAGTGGNWRALMPLVHDAAAELAGRNSVRLTWRGEPKIAGEGPYRIEAP